MHYLYGKCVLPSQHCPSSKSRTQFCVSCTTKSKKVRILGTYLVHWQINANVFLISLHDPIFETNMVGIPNVLQQGLPTMQSLTQVQYLPNTCPLVCPPKTTPLPMHMLKFDHKTNLGGRPNTKPWHSQRSQPLMYSI